MTWRAYYLTPYREDDWFDPLCAGAGVAQPGAVVTARAAAHATIHLTAAAATPVAPKPPITRSTKPVSAATVAAVVGAVGAARGAAARAGRPTRPRSAAVGAAAELKVGRCSSGDCQDSRFQSNSKRDIFEHELCLSCS